MNPDPVINTMRSTARTLTCGDVREKLRAVPALQDALDGVKTALLFELDASKDYEIDGASTLNAWVRNELRLTARQASLPVKSAAALRDLPLVAEAALAGLISAVTSKCSPTGSNTSALNP